MDDYLLKGVESDLQVASGFLLTDLGGPLDFLKDKLDRLTVAVSTVDDVSLFVYYDGGGGWTGGLQL